MKRYLVMPLLCVLVLLVCACAAKPEPQESSSAPEPSTAAPSSAAPESSQTEPPPSTEESVPPASETPEIAYETVDQRLNPYRNMVGEAWAQVISAVRNTGETPLLLESSPFQVRSKDGTAVASDSRVSAYPQVIAPGETGYYYVETYLETEDLDGLTLEFTPKVSEAAGEQLFFSTTETSLRDSRYGGMELVGMIRNSTQADAKHYCIAVLLFDAEGRLAGQFSDVPSEVLKASATQHFELSSFMLPDTLKAADVAEYSVLAYELAD